METETTPLIYDSLSFTNCDYCILKLLRLNLMDIEANKFVFYKAQQVLSEIQQILDQKGLIDLTINGQVRFITPRAEYLLNRYFPLVNSNSLPDCIQQWFKQQILQLSFYNDTRFSYLPLCILQVGQQLIINFVFDSSEERYFLLLEEQELAPFSVPALEMLGLTRREAEALFWIAKDKSNAAIAKMLGCCEGTVRKHIEHLYKKLGVQTRIGAVMVALERLGLFSGE